MLLVIDNYDSFTYNIVQTIATTALENGYEQEIKVVRNDKITIAEIEALAPEKILISPGPCSPKEAGISVAVIKHFAGKLPILGVCLGHQSMAYAFGAPVVRAKRLMHGKTSPMIHDGKGVFAGLPSPFEGMRYHSLIVEEEDLPSCFEATCHTDQGELMGIRHKELLLEGVQFHPESVMSPVGVALLANFMSADYGK
ncbi:MAG: aminodeoxychorismate/anthranilate synthase component II [Desulfotalea sp.]